jgi:hypothetical protein
MQASSVRDLAHDLVPRGNETFSGVDLDQKGSTKNLTVNRRYLDPNRVTYEVCYFWHFFVQASYISSLSLVPYELQGLRV